VINKNKYQTAMNDWPELSPYGGTIYLEKSNLSIYIYAAGDPANTPVVMIHGLGDEADTWRHIFLPLAESYRVIALDLPGFGRSDKPDLKYTPAFMMEKILELLNILQVNQAVLMGSSLGAILAHQIAIDHPDRVNGLILVGGSLLQSDPMGDWRLTLMRIPVIGEWLYTRLRKNPDAAYNSIRNVYYNLDEMPSEDREFLYERVNKRVWSDGQKKAYFSTLRKFIPWVKEKQGNIEHKLENLNIQTLLIRGEFDQLFSDINLQNVVSFQPDVSIATINGAGHLPHQEKPDRFLKTVLDWLAGQKISD
jgi:pimeloyl-ACP methyl ester carboxylesterase